MLNSLQDADIVQVLFPDLEGVSGTSTVVLWPAWQFFGQAPCLAMLLALPAEPVRDPLSCWMSCSKQAQWLHAVNLA